MDQNTDIVQMLELMTCPAFCVKDGTITAVNAEARRCMLSPGQPVKELLITGQQEYPQFREGCLHLTLKVSEMRRGASVKRMNGLDIFLLEQDEGQAELQAMALAAQELRSPLSNIMTVAEDLLPLCAAEDDESQALTAQITKGLYQLQRIVCNMSDAYRYSQEDTPRMEYRDMGTFWNEFFASGKELLSHAGINLQYTGLSEKVFSLADGDKLERAANNILSNAMKFSPKGSTIEVSLTRRGGMLYLTVQDSGAGETAELAGNLFNRFLRQPSIEDPRYGIGLGMVLIRSIASLHGGTVLLEQIPDRGLRLTMSMAILQRTDALVHTNMLRVDYAGERDHALVELSECLPTALYAKEKTK